MDPRLIWVTQSGSVDALYSLIIQKDPCILQNTDVLPFTHTPLREASSTGKIDLAMELMILKPSFANKLNSDGFSPLHLAVENHQVELALELQLVKFDPNLVPNKDLFPILVQSLGKRWIKKDKGMGLVVKKVTSIILPSFMS
ncbi:unnamed protein product [Thlaspi arvense]|uniref:Uncharacterized protein n=1 Tax=Thlaspi arvense TaxID=13288 RepID=A0AAU9R755_THLAR|nr:unnamed protein product [Thlaspi arvense]